MKKIIIAGLVATFSLISSPSFSQEVPSNVEWTIPFGVGGGTDVWARFISPHLSKQLDTPTTFIIKNVPGGGSITGTNLFYQRARENGSNIIGISASTIFPLMLGDSRVRYSFDKWTPLMASPTGGVVYIQPEFNVTSAEDLHKVKDVVLPFAAQGPTQLELPVLIALDMLGLNIRAVFGMTSRGEGRLAFERGESKIDFQTTSAYMNSVAGLVNDGKAIPLFSLGILDESGKTVRDPAFPDIPTFEEFYTLSKGEEPSGLQYEAYNKFMTAGFALQKAILIPSKAPESVKAKLLEAMTKMVEDPDFKNDAIEQIGPYENILGEQAGAYLEQAIAMTPELHSWVKDWLKSKYNVTIE